MAKFAMQRYDGRMRTMNVSVTDELKTFVDEQVDRGGFGSTSEFVRSLLRREQQRLALRTLLLDGASSAPGAMADDRYFEVLRKSVAVDA